jgi:T-complex protein 1 subunit zeta
MWIVKNEDNLHFLHCSEVNAGFFYKSAAEREKLVQAERTFIDQRVQKLIEFKHKVCDGTDKNFVIINQKVCTQQI